MSVRRVLALLAVAAVAAGCSSDHKAAAPPTTTVTTPRSDAPPPRNAQERAVQACANVAPKEYVNAKATTVGAIHAIRGGPGNVPGYTWILKAAPPQSFAAWCWRQPKPGYFKGYVVGPNGEVVDTGQESSGAGSPTPGPLAVT
jgi:hypothetical protein